MKKDIQPVWVLRKLESGQAVTSMKAFEVGITRLSSIILRLRRSGWDITTTMINPKEKGHAPYAEYRLNKAI